VNYKTNQLLCQGIWEGYKFVISRNGRNRDDFHPCSYKRGVFAKLNVLYILSLRMAVFVKLAQLLHVLWVVVF